MIFFSFSVILNIPLFEFRILHIFHLFQLLVLKRPQTKFKIHHVQAIYPSVSSINESKELFWKSRNSPFCCWYVSGDQKWIFIADTDVAAVVKTRFFLKQKIYTHYILIAILKWKYKRSRPAKVRLYCYCFWGHEWIFFYNILRIVTSNSEYFKSPWKIPVKCITTPSTDITDFLCCDAQNPSKHVIQTVVNSQEQAYTYIVMWKMYLVKSWIMIMNFRFRYIGIV